jgi:vacuolar protein sorting-associated protein VTA1
MAAVPQNFKQLQHYLKTAAEHDIRDPVVAYYCRLYAMQKGMEIDRKSPESRQFLAGLMNSLEETKNKHRDLEAIQNEIIGQAHLENYALKLFLYADNEDRAGRFGMWLNHFTQPAC